MSAAEQIDDMQLPGGIGMPSISNANDDQLKHCLASDIQFIRQLMEAESTKPDRDGMAPAAWRERARGNRSMQNNLAAVERSERRIVAIQQELESRESARKAEAEQQSKRADQRLTELVEKAPDNAKRLADRAEELMPSVERVRQLVADLEAFALATGIAPAYSILSDGSERAARELDVDAPKLAELPEGLPSKREFDTASAMLAGRHGGFNIRPGLPGDYAKVDQIARDRK